jgi:hypothetical protein
MLVNLTADISKSMGGTLTEEVEKMLELFTTNSELIENNFTFLHKRIDDLEHTIK